MRLHSIQNMQDAITYLYQPQCFPKPEAESAGGIQDSTSINSSVSSPPIVLTPSEFVDI